MGEGRRSRVRCSAESLPLPEGSLGLPLVGETLSLLSNPDRFGVDRRNRYGDIWKTNILGQQVVMVYGETNVLEIIKQEGRKVESAWPTATKILVGDVFHRCVWRIVWKYALDRGDFGHPQSTAPAGGAEEFESFEGG